MKKFLFFVAILAPLIGCSTWKPEKNLMLKPSGLVIDQTLTVRYFGASTILFSDGETSILIDGFFSRPSVREAIVKGLKPNNHRVSKLLDDYNIDKIDAVLISHSHFDHVMDSGYVADANNSAVFGSEQAIKIVKKNNNIDTNIIENNQTVNIGLFSIKFYKTPHIKKSRIFSIIERIFLTLSRGLVYRDTGNNYSFLISHKNLKILVVPSAGYEANMLSGVKANVVFLSVGLLGNKENPYKYIQKYWHETVVNTDASLVIPIHWDKIKGKSLTPTPYPIDNLGTSIKIITELSKSGGKKISICYPSNFAETFRIESPLHLMCK